MSAERRAKAAAEYGPGGTKEASRASWKAHLASGKPMSQWSPPKTPHVSDRYFHRTGVPPRRTNLERSVSKTVKLNNPKTFTRPPRSIKESLVNRGPSQRAASSYLSKAKPAVGLLKKIAKTAGRVAGPVGVALTAYDVVDTVRTIKETVGAARELGRVRAAGRAAEAGTASIEKAMRAKYPLAGTEYEAISKKLPKTKHGTTIGGGILKVN